MNKYQTALDHRKEEYENMFHNLEIEKNAAFYEDFELLQELVDKAMPMELRYEGDGYWNGELIYDTAICCGCDRNFEVDYDEHSNYCPNCGQKLEWENERGGNKT